jgi:hypothetical protein
MVPPSPTTTCVEGDAATPRRVTVALLERDVQLAPSAEVATQAPTRLEPVTSSRPAGETARPPRQGTPPTLVQVRPSLDRYAS